jgi:hypothetical protein
LIYFCRYKLPAALAEFIDEPAVPGSQLNGGKNLRKRQKKREKITHDLTETTSL